jgi:DNA-binding response OmpR family regulator
MRAGKLVLIVGPGAPQRLLAGALETRGFRALRAASAEEGIRLALDVRPDVVLTELYVPDERGLCVAEILKHDARTAGIPVVVWTARTFPEDRERATRAAADVFLPKPAGIAELLRVVEALAGGA